MATKTTKSSKPDARSKGVPAKYLSEHGTFRPGLDARYKSDLIRSALGEDGVLMTFTKADALKRLAAMGWLPHLERAKATRAKTRSKRARANAEEGAGK